MTEKSKRLHLDLTDSQIKKIKRFLLGHKIKCDGKTQFGLICEPQINQEWIIVRLLSSIETEKVDKFFRRIGLYNE